VIRRVFWIAAGATAGIVVARQLRSAAESLTPTSIAGGLLDAVRDFFDDVRVAMAEREIELRRELGFDDPDVSADAHLYTSSPTG
jgi:hypothetical protein